MFPGPAFSMGLRQDVARPFLTGGLGLGTAIAEFVSDGITITVEDGARTITLEGGDALAVLRLPPDLLIRLQAARVIRVQEHDAGTVSLHYNEPLLRVTLAPRSVVVHPFVPSIEIEDPVQPTQVD